MRKRTPNSALQRARAERGRVQPEGMSAKQGARPTPKVEPELAPLGEPPASAMKYLRHLRSWDRRRVIWLLIQILKLLLMY